MLRNGRIHGGPAIARPSMDGLDPPLAPNNPPRRRRLQKESYETSAKGNGPAILPATNGTCGDRRFSMRPDDGISATGFGCLLVVQLW